MAHNSSGLITAPVDQKADVQYVLTGSTSGSIALSTLCKHANINRWAKYKPVRWSGDTRSSTWYTAYNNGCGFIFSSGSTIFTDLIDMVNAWIGKNGYAWESFWPYYPPDGSTYPYRLLDFNNYKHSAAKPWTTYNMPTDVVRYYYDGAYTIGAQASIYANPDTTYALSVNDIKVPYGAGYLDMKSMYFAMAFVYNYGSSASNWQYAFQSTYCDWNTDATSDTHDGSYGKTIRMTPVFSTKSMPYNGSYLAFPFLSSTRLWDTGTTGSGNPIILQYRSSYAGTFVPLPYNGIVTTVSSQTISIQLSLSLQRTGSGTLKLTMTARNTTSAQQTLYYSYITYSIWVYPKNSQGSPNYQDGHNYTSTWGTGSTTIAANGSVTSTITVNYTEYSGYGSYITATMTSSVGYISGASASLDY